jgi:hypothetical protein
VHTDAVEGLLEQSVLAEATLTPEALAAVGTSEKANRQRWGVAQGESGIVRSEKEEVLLQCPLIFRRLDACLAKVVL